jgi:hypothetical protein
VAINFNHKPHRNIEMATPPKMIFGKIVACDISANMGYPINGGLATAFLLTFSLKHTDETGDSSKRAPSGLIGPYMLSAPKDLAEQPLVLKAAKLLLDSYFKGRVVSFSPSIRGLPYIEAASVR